MAETKKFNFGPFYGGLSNDDFMTQEGGFIYSSGIDNQPSTDFFKLGKKAQNAFTVTDGNEISQFIEANDSIFGLKGNGEIVDKDGNVVYTRSSDDYVDGVEFNGYLWLLVYKGTATKMTVDRIDVTNIDADWSGDVTEDFKELTEPVDRRNVMQVLANVLVIGVNNIIHRIDKSDILQSFDSVVVNQILNITKSGTFKVFCENGDIAYWNGANNEPSQFLNIGNNIRDVFNKGGNDYIIAGKQFSDSEFGIISGYKIETIGRKNYSYSTDIDKFQFKVFNIKSMDYRKNLFFLVAGDGSDDSIYTYGSKILGLNKSFANFVKVASSGNNISTVYALKTNTSKSRLYISLNDGIDDLVDYIDFSANDTQDNGFLITKVFNAGNDLIKKGLKEVNFMINGTDASNTVEIQYALNGNSSFTSLKTINTNYDEKTRIPVYLSEFFYDIKFKILLTSDGTTEGPFVYDLDIVYDDNIEP